MSKSLSHLLPRYGPNEPVVPEVHQCDDLSNRPEQVLIALHELRPSPIGSYQTQKHQQSSPLVLRKPEKPADALVLDPPNQRQILQRMEQVHNQKCLPPRI